MPLLATSSSLVGGSYSKRILPGRDRNTFPAAMPPLSENCRNFDSMVWTPSKYCSMRARSALSCWLSWASRGGAEAGAAASAIKAARSKGMRRMGGLAGFCGRRPARPWRGLERINERDGHHGCIMDAELFGEKEASALLDQPVLILARQIHAGLLVGQGLMHREIGPHPDTGRLGIEDADVGDEMPHPARHIHRGLQQRHDAVPQHAAAFGEDDAERQPELDIFARGHAVEAILGEEVGPARELLVVEHRRIIVIERLDAGAQLVAGLGEDGRVHGQYPMTSR